jgi:hypothetical protein
MPNVGVSDYDRRVEFIAALQDDPGRCAFSGDNLCHFGAGSDLRTELLRGAGESLREITDAAAYESGRAQRAVRFAELVMEPVESSSLLARADEGSKHTGAGERGLEQVAVKPFVQHVRNAHRQNAQKLVHLLFAETMELPANF